jgi:signal peptidase I
MTRESQFQAAGCDLLADVVRSAGSATLKVTGQSMLPAIRPGDLLTVQRHSPQGLQPGQIILIQRNQKLTAHRVVRVCGEQLVTRGDSVPSLDPPIPASEVVGVVTAIHRNGRPIGLGFSLWKRAVAFVLRHSEWCTRLYLSLSCRLSRFEGGDATPEPVDTTIRRTGP